MGGYTGVSNAEQGDPALKPPESENEVELHRSDANLPRYRLDFINFLNICGCSVFALLKNWKFKLARSTSTQNV